MFRFVANLKPYTLHRGRGIRRFDYYLISTDYSQTHRRLVKEVHRYGRGLAADNGNFDLIGALIKQFAPQAAAVRDKRHQEEKRLGDKLRPDTISAELRREYRELAEQVRAVAQSHNQVSRIASIHAQQEALAPSYRIGAEDLTMAALSGLRMEPAYLGWNGSDTARFSQFPIEFTERSQRGEFGATTGKIYTGLHGMDYDTSFMAGRMAAEANCAAISTGLGAALSDNGYTNYWVKEGQVHPFPRNLPRAYVSFAQLIAGFFDGYRSVHQTVPDFHALGLGTPILLVLLGAMARPGVNIHADSTAPIKDAEVSRTICLYVDQPAPLKLKAHRIAEYWLKYDYGWYPESAKSRQFNERYPPQLDKARRWWRDEGERKLQNRDLAMGTPLSNYLPLLGRPSDPEIRWQAAHARIHHNHWTLACIEKSINKHLDDRDGLREYIEQTVNRYLDTPHADPRWQAAVAEAWSIIKQASL